MVELYVALCSTNKSYKTFIENKCSENVLAQYQIEKGIQKEKGGGFLYPFFYTCPIKC